MTSKRPFWGTPSKFRRSTERIIDGNSIQLPSIIGSVERRNVEVVPQDGRFDVISKGSIQFKVNRLAVILLRVLARYMTICIQRQIRDKFVYLVILRIQIGNFKGKI